MKNKISLGLVFLFLVFLSGQIWFPNFFLVEKSTVWFAKATAPFVAVGRGLVYPIEFIKNLSSSQAIKKDLEDASTKLSALTGVLAENALLAEENQRLRLDLALPERRNKNYVACEVLSYQINIAGQKAKLSCGADRGVTVGRGVLSQGSLIGTVREVGERTSEVLLLQASDSTVEARLAYGGVGVVRGSFGMGMVFDLVPKGALVKKGDLVVSAGVSGKISEGFLIGEIGEEISKESQLEKKYSVIPLTVWRGSSSVLVELP